MASLTCFPFVYAYNVSRVKSIVTCSICYESPDDLLPDVMTSSISKVCKFPIPKQSRQWEQAISKFKIKISNYLIKKDKPMLV